MGDMADSIEWFVAWQEDERECPECGNILTRSEDLIGVTYQCNNLCCLSFFTEDEID